MSNGSNETLKRLERELEAALDGLSPIERALLVAKVMREVYECDYTIEARADGSFVFLKGGAK